MQRLKKPLSYPPPYVNLRMWVIPQNTENSLIFGIYAAISLHPGNKSGRGLLFDKELRVVTMFTAWNEKLEK